MLPMIWRVYISNYIRIISFIQSGHYSPFAQSAAQPLRALVPWYCWALALFLLHPCPWYLWLLVLMCPPLEVSLSVERRSLVLEEANRMSRPSLLSLEAWLGFPLARACWSSWVGCPERGGWAGVSPWSSLVGYLELFYWAHLLRGRSALWRRSLTIDQLYGPSIQVAEAFWKL